MAKKPTPDWHQMDQRELRIFKVDFDSELVKKEYRIYRDIYDDAGQPGKLPEAILLMIAGKYRSAHKGSSYKPPEAPPHAKPEPTVTFDDGEHADSDI
jgi:hypothetical protein